MNVLLGGYYTRSSHTTRVLRGLLRSWGVNVETYLVNLIVRAFGLDLRTGSEAHLKLA